MVESRSSIVETVEAIGERALIDRIRARIPASPGWVIIGIGDDAAVVEPARNTLDVITTDALVEGVHFDRAFCGAGDIGHKALAVNLSDLAAMGAAPRAALLSLMLPPALPVTDVNALVDAMMALAQRSQISFVGGNITRSSGPLVVDVTVTGSIGGAAAGLNALRAGLSAEAALGREGGSAEAGQKYLRPEPRLRVGILLGRNRAARACIDLSDGLADAVRQVAEASGVGAVIEAHALPIQPKTMSVREAITGGEDYELLFTVSPKMRGRLNGVRRLVKDLPITKIGIITADRALLLDIDGKKEELPPGFEHFK